MKIKTQQEVKPIGKFSLFQFLSTDLRKAHKLLHGDLDNVSSLKLFMGFFSPRFFPVVLCRVAYFFYCIKLKPIAKFFSFINFLFFGIEIAIQCQIGKGLFLPHTQGTVIGAFSIGDDATIFQGVTIGARELDFSFNKSLRPIICDGVTIGAGAKVLGGLTVGSDARIGANAVVLESIPANFLAVGVPARLINPLN